MAPASSTRAGKPETWSACTCVSNTATIGPQPTFAQQPHRVAGVHAAAAAVATARGAGEVMLGGTMSPMHMAMGRTYHLELRVCSRASGAIVTGAAPTISVTDAKGMTRRLPVAEMEGIGEGRADYHYGNNVALTPGSRITVTVVLRGERAVFRLTVPKKARAMKR